MRILQINTRYYNGGSTGRIAYDLKCVMEANGIESYMAYGFGYTPTSKEENTVYRIESDKELFMSKIWTKLIGKHGFNNRNETKHLLKWIAQVKPDLIHMHNIHNHYLNIELLFTYIAQHNIPCVLTMHDCWTFTGHCAYFDLAKCEKWRTGCNHCPSLRDYPKTFALKDPSNWNYNKKRALFEPLNITFISPSQWLANLQGESFLKNKACKVINNGVDTSIFKPMGNDVRSLYDIGNRKIILAVAAELSPRKGGKYLLQLPLFLRDDEVLVLVGLLKGQEKCLPKNGKVIGIQRTKTPDELIGLYSEANVFINPTLEDNFPTTNLEALACGTPLVTFATGGSGECVDDATGLVVERGNLGELLTAIRVILAKGKQNYSVACRQKALEKYDKDNQYLKYIDLYKEVVK